jgi:hypothetical protein
MSKRLRIFLAIGAGFLLLIILNALMARRAPDDPRREPAATPSPAQLVEPPAVIVWITESGIKDGEALIRAGQPDLAVKYAACIVPPGTRAVMMTGGYGAAHITIVDGGSRGCQGYVLREPMGRLLMDR